MNKKFSLSYDQAAFILRIGVGLVFVSGGLAKLSKLLMPSEQAAMVSLYMSPAGYINQFFANYLFYDGIVAGFISPWFFLTSLSFLEFVAGVALIVGLGVRLFSFLFAVLCWTFVISLPVVNATGFEIAEKTHTAPAILVMIRDIALSGILLALYNLGSGVWSLDEKLFGPIVRERKTNWDNIGLFLRLSLGFVFVIGGAFYGLENIKSFAPPYFLLPIGIILLVGNGTRYASYAAMAVMGWYMLTLLSLDKSIVGNLNSMKREFGLFASAIVLSQLGGGQNHTLSAIINEIQILFKQAPFSNQTKVQG